MADLLFGAAENADQAPADQGFFDRLADIAAAGVAGYYAERRAGQEARAAEARRSATASEAERSRQRTEDLFKFGAALAVLGFFGAVLIKKLR